MAPVRLVEKESEMERGRRSWTNEESITLVYTAADNLPLVSNYKDIRGQNNGANYTAGRTKVAIDALFDNVKLNPEAVP